MLLEAAADRRLLLRPRAPLLVNIKGYADFANADFHAASLHGRPR